MLAYSCSTDYPQGLQLYAVASPGPRAARSAAARTGHVFSPQLQYGFSIGTAAAGRDVTCSRVADSASQPLRWPSLRATSTSRARSAPSRLQRDRTRVSLQLQQGLSIGIAAVSHDSPRELRPEPLRPAPRLQSCATLCADSGERVWEGCGKTGKGLQGPASPRQPRHNPRAIRAALVEGQSIFTAWSAQAPRLRPGWWQSIAIENGYSTRAGGSASVRACSARSSRAASSADCRATASSRPPTAAAAALRRDPRRLGPFCRRAVGVCCVDWGPPARGAKRERVELRNELRLTRLRLTS